MINAWQDDTGVTSVEGDAAIAGTVSICLADKSLEETARKNRAERTEEILESSCDVRAAMILQREGLL